ncbi:MAG: GHKL domain-containing protein [Bacteroidetes bacterium]|nr:GHKL domain-containing protein [Bacteroidota bacterium]
MVFRGHMIRITLRLGIIFLCMLALALMIGQQARLFSVLAILLFLLALIVELFYRINRNNRIIESLLESVRSEDYNRRILEGVKGLGYDSLANSAQTIITAISSAKIEKETQYQYLQTILQHIHTAVLTLDESGEPELINPLALNTLGIYNTKRPSWSAIEKASPLFAGAVKSLGESGRQMIRLSNTPSGKQLLILLNTVKIGGGQVKIITFQDIEPEIEQKEMESWQTISRIMAHEIMNSLTPLSSLTETGIMMLEKEGRPGKLEELGQLTIDNLYTALKTISARNQALTKFIGNYRQFSRLPEPEKEEIRVSELLDEITLMHQARCEEKGIRCSNHTGPENLLIMADGSQLKQVLINLVKNAIEAVADVAEPKLGITVKRILDHVSVEVSDNGEGIPPEILEKIFVPFYTTKKEGSGIGLSLSRQIIRNHGGQISVESDPGEGSTFKVSLPVK